MDPGFIVFLVFLAVGPPVALALQKRWARRKAARRQQGEDIRVGVHLRSTAKPLPSRWKQGSIRTGEWPLRFRVWHRMSPPIVLAGLTLLRREVGAVPNFPEPVVVFRLRGATGSVVELATRREYADLLDDVLRADPTLSMETAPARFGGAPLWVLLVSALSPLWLAGWLYIALAGEVVPARILANDEGYCSVTWTRGDARHSAEVECNDESPGETLDVLAMPPPFESEAADVVYTPLYVAFLAAFLLVPLAVWALRRWLARRKPFAIPTSPTPALVAETEVPRLERFELRWSTITEAVARRAAAEGWADAPPTSWWERRGRTPERRLLLRSLPKVLWPLVPFGVVLLFCMTSIDAAVSPMPTEEAQAVVTYVDDVPVMPDVLDVRYTVDGVAVEATVSSVLDGVEEDDTVAIRYDPDDTDSARLVDGDGTEAGVRAFVIAAVVCLAIMLIASILAVFRYRRLRRARAEEPKTMRYAIARGGVGELGMMLFPLDGDPRPDFVVPMDALLPADLPVVGTAEIRGELADGSSPLVTVGRHDLFPPEPVVEVGDTEALAAFVNADYSFYEDDDD